MSNMEYHEIGETFYHEDVKLQVCKCEKGINDEKVCEGCYFYAWGKGCGLKDEVDAAALPAIWYKRACTPEDRKDHKNIIYKFVGRLDLIPQSTDPAEAAPSSCAHENGKTEDKSAKADEDGEFVAIGETFIYEGKKFTSAYAHPRGTVRTIHDICTLIEAVIEAKNTDYNSAYHHLYKEIGIDYAYGKLFEKLHRIGSLRHADPAVKGESLLDSLYDLAGYAILTIKELTKEGNDGK